jgi:hypothetical protein
MNCSVFWHITPCSPLKVNVRFGVTCSFHLKGRRLRKWQAAFALISWSTYFSTLKMKTYSSETLVHFRWNTWPYIPEERTRLSKVNSSVYCNLLIFEIEVEVKNCDVNARRCSLNLIWGSFLYEWHLFIIYLNIVFRISKTVVSDGCLFVASLKIAHEYMNIRLEHYSGMDSDEGDCFLRYVAC